MERIILASASPRRKQLLEWAEINFDVKVSDADESYAEGLNAEEVAIYIARKKLYAVKQLVEPDSVIIAADTIVVLNGEIIGKPADRFDAINILSRLSGTRHLVITGVIIVRKDREEIIVDTTEVWFHELSAAQIEFYVDKYQPYDKAGAYAIQEWIGVVGIKQIKGDFYNVMGLPISRVVKKLSEFSD